MSDLRSGKKTPNAILFIITDVFSTQTDPQSNKKIDKGKGEGLSPPARNQKTLSEYKKGPL